VANAIGDATEMVMAPPVAADAFDANLQRLESQVHGGLLSSTNMLATATRVLATGPRRGSDDTRNSAVLVEEEHPEWIHQLLQPGNR